MEESRERWFRVSDIPLDMFKSCDYYYVSDLGRVKSIYNGKEKILSQSIRKSRPTARGYYRVRLQPIKKSVSVHRLVALAFMFNDNHDILTVDHIDEDVFNNRLDNLQWMSALDNSLKSNLGRYNRFGLEERQRIKDEFIIERKSYNELCNKYDCSIETIHSIVNDERLYGVNNRKRNSFSIEKKREICKRYKNGESVKTLVQEYNCAKTYIYKILKEEKEGMLNE